MKNKKLTLTIIGVIALILITIGLSYAYWLITKTQTNQNLITSACLDISMTNEKNDINLGQQYPISDADGLALTPYEFTVTNNCNVALDYQIALEATGTEASALKATSLKVALDDTVALLSSKETTTTTVSGAYKSYILGYGTLGPKNESNASATHTLKIWIDENAPIDERNKSFTSKITVTIGQGIEAPPFAEGTLAYSIYNNAIKDNYLYTEEPSFTESISDSESGLYKTQDDLGDTYFFRGNVENNYVQFGTYANDTTVSVYDSSADGIVEKTIPAGSDMYWRIVRVNGDDTIRLIYTGTSLDDNNISDQIDTATFYSNNNDIGYTNIDENGNQVDSTIKENLDSWYEANLKSKYGTFISDSIFCNDREIFFGEYFDENYVSTDKDNSYYKILVYAPDDRIHDNTPKLICTQTEDKYTMSKNLGNGLLKNPIATITSDEIIMAGKYSYITSSSNFWTMSPQGYNNVDVSFPVYLSDLSIEQVDHDAGIRPVINLKVDVPFTGNGSYDTPYVIGTN